MGELKKNIIKQLILIVLVSNVFGLLIRCPWFMLIWIDICAIVGVAVGFKQLESDSN